MKIPSGRWGILYKFASRNARKQTNLKTVLYISYDGLTDALGQSQILPYLTRLSERGYRIVILSFEKPEKFRQGRQEIESIVAHKNIVWTPLLYTKTPPVLSTLYDIYTAKRVAKKLCKQYQCTIVHCRGYVSAMVGRYLKQKLGLKFIFDMRGWWADEKLESGYWNKSLYKPVYRYVKRVEAQFFRQADYIVSLTEAGKKEIVAQKAAPEEKIGVIPTCVDFSIFKPFSQEVRETIRAQFKIPLSAKVLIYSGSLGGNYDVNIILKIFKAFSERFSESYLLILSKDSLSEQELASLKAKGNIIITSVPFRKVSDCLMAGDAGLIIYKPAFSLIGRSPTKLGEYWATGLSAISIEGVGDLEAICKRYPSGSVLLQPDLSDLLQKIHLLSFKDKHALREHAKDYYDVEKGANFYEGIYRTLEKMAR